MPTTIPNGEVQELVSDAQPDATYNVDVNRNDVLLARTKPEAERGHGRRVEAGYKGEITTHRPGESVWGFAPTGPTEVTVKQSGFSLSLFPRRQTMDPSDHAVETDAIAFSTASGTVSADTNSSALIHRNDSAEELHRAHVVTGYMDTESPSVKITLKVQDDERNFTHSMNPTDFPLEYPKPIPIPPGTDFEYEIYNGLSSAVEFDFSVYVTKGDA